MKRIRQPLIELQDKHSCTHGGVADNPAIRLDRVGALARAYAHDPAQLEARLFGHFTRPLGLAIQYDPKQLRTFTDDEIRALVVQEGTEAKASIDFGWYRFAFLLLLVDRAGAGHVIGEMFSQKQSLRDRAKRIHALVSLYGIEHLLIGGDSANPQDIAEINREFGELDYPYVCRGVSKTSGDGRPFVQASVGRINNLLGRGALTFRRQLAERQTWRLGMTAATEGTPQIGSRLMYELGAWRYLAPKQDGKAQDQKPDDNTADGADMMACLRYVVQMWLGPARREPLTVKEQVERLGAGDEYDAEYHNVLEQKQTWDRKRVRAF